MKWYSPIKLPTAALSLQVIPNAFATPPEAMNLLANATTMMQIVQAHILPVLSNVKSVLNPLRGSHSSVSRAVEMREDEW